MNKEPNQLDLFVKVLTGTATAAEQDLINGELADKESGLSLCLQFARESSGRLLGVVPDISMDDYFVTADGEVLEKGQSSSMHQNIDL